jgi:UPF0148 protein
MAAKSEDIKRMADLLRQGATLTDLACPACASPLFKLKNGELWCAKDQKKVIVVKGDNGERTTNSFAMDKLEAILLSKIQDLQNKIEKTENIDELQKLSAALSELLDNLEKARRMKKRQ